MDDELDRFAQFALPQRGMVRDVATGLDARSAADDYFSELRDVIDGLDPLTSPDRLVPVVLDPTDADLQPCLGRPIG